MSSSIMKYFEYQHLPAHLQEVSKPIGDLAKQMDEQMELEPRVVRLITTITEYQCDDCKEGLMIRDRGCNDIQLTSPPRFKHICTKCGSTDWLSDSYPLANNSYNPSDTVSESDAERIRQLEQTVLNMGKQIERLSQDVQSAKSGWL